MRLAVYMAPASGRHGFSHRAELRERVGTVLEGDQDLAGLDVTWVEDRPSLAEASAAADCLLVVLPRVPSSPPPWTRDLPPHTPVVVAAVGDPAATALALRRARIAEVVRIGAARSEWTSAVRRAWASGVFGQAVTLIRNLDALSEPLRDWLQKALEKVPPYPTVEEAARWCGSSVPGH